VSTYLHLSEAPVNTDSSWVCLISLVSLMVWISILLDTVNQEKYLVLFVCFSISRSADTDLLLLPYYLVM